LPSEIKDKKIYPYILPVSHKYAKALRPELDPKKGSGKKFGRNDPCSCGSGKKYKKCFGR